MFSQFLSPRTELLSEKPPMITFATGETIGCTNQASKGANTAPRNLLFYFLFHVLPFQ